MVQQTTRRVLRPAEPTPERDDRRAVEPSPSAWKTLTKDLDSGNVAKCRRFCADAGIPFEMIPVLVAVLSEDRRLDEALATLADDPEAAELLKAELVLVQQARPQTPADIGELAKRLVTLPKEIRKAEARQRDFEQATLERVTLRKVFAELFNGTAGMALESNDQLPLPVQNALAKNGFGNGVIYHTPWREL